MDNKETDQAAIALRLGADPAEILKLYTVKDVAHAVAKVYGLLTMASWCARVEDYERRCTRRCRHYGPCANSVAAYINMARRM